MPKQRIPDLPSTSSPNFLQRIKDVINAGLDDASGNRVITVDDLVNAGIASRANTLLMPGPTGTTPSTSLITAGDVYQPAYVVDPAVPPTPTGLSVTAGLTTLFIQHDAPTFTVGHGYLRTLVYGTKYSGTGALPTYTEGVTPLLTEFQGQIGTYGINPNEEWHVWIKWKSQDGILSGIAGGTSGASSISSKVVGTQIANATIGAALISDLGVDKITAGSLQAGSFIRSSNYVAGTSGFNIPATGTVEFGDGTFRGTINASAGTIGTAVIGTNYMQSTNWVAAGSGWRIQSDGTIFANTGVNCGAFTGYAWPAAGGVGAHLSASGLLLGNGNTAHYFQVDANGNLFAPSFSINNGNLTLAGGLIRNAANTANINLNAAGSSLLMWAGTLTNYGSYRGNHYPIEIGADGSGFFARDVVMGGSVRASGTYAIPNAQMPAVYWSTNTVTYAGGGTTGGGP